MESQLSIDARKQLDRFSRQYLQLQLHLDYPSSDHLRHEAFQNVMYAKLFQDGALKHTPPQRYQLRVLKELTKRIEQSIQDWEEEGISDDLMNSLSSLVCASLPSEATSAQTKAYVTYTLSSLSQTPQSIPDGKTNRAHDEGNAANNEEEPKTITLLESRNLLSASGTTGLRTWEAALHLSSYVVAHPSLTTNQSILELGAGTGFLSILCAKYLDATHVLCTDGSEDVVSALSTNFYLNGLQDQDGEVIQARELKWGYPLLGTEEKDWNGGRKVDLVLGTDLTYDSTGIPALVGTFGELFDLYDGVKVLMAATIRNEVTFGRFLECVRAAGLGVQDVEWKVLESEKQEGPFYEGGVPIRLVWITRGSQDSAAS